MVTHGGQVEGCFCGESIKVHRWGVEMNVGLREIKSWQKLSSLVASIRRVEFLEVF